MNYSELLAFGKNWHVTEVNTAANGDQTIYLGKTLDNDGHPSDANWCIKEITIINTSGKQTIVEKYADGNMNFDNVWNNRATLTYKYLV